MNIRVRQVTLCRVLPHNSHKNSRFEYLTFTGIKMLAYEYIRQTHSGAQILLQKGLRYIEICTVMANGGEKIGDFGVGKRDFAFKSGGEN